jgi:hypothetical protein
MLSRVIRAGAAVVAVLTALCGATACGAPEFTYVKNSDDKTYFKVPHEWHEISEDDLDDLLIGGPAESQQSKQLREVSWSVAYDAAADPSALHLTSADTTDDPIVYARVRRLTVGERDAMSLDALRDSFGLPVTDQARQQYAQAAGEDSPLRGFELLHDEVLTPSDTVRGVRVVFNYLLPSGVLHTFDLTAYLTNSGDRLFQLVLRCSARCYQDRTEELNSIVTSFTVRNQ